MWSDRGRLADPGDVTADHYHRWEEDLDLLAQLGVDAYRFSVAWTRILPDGRGGVNRAGVDFYRRLLQGLVDREIAPMLTLYHWDLPLALHAEGGWAARGIVTAFTEYAGVVAEELGDLVSSWITHNEPWVTAFLGHLEGVFPPGVTDWPTALRAGHHLLVSHGAAVDVIRGVDPEATVGIALDCRPSYPADEGSEDANNHFDGFRNRWFFDPVFGKGYPDDMVTAYESAGRLPGGIEGLVEEGDLETIATPIDFIGINYYTTLQVAVGDEESDEPEGPVGPDPPPGFTEMGWRSDPDGLSAFLERVARDYDPESILVTENGASYSDAPDETGRVRDERRIAYLDAHIEAVLSARARGVPVDGYFVWSLLDNLEWVHGFSQRFGLVWVDHETGERIPKDSYFWYRDRIESA